MEQLDLKIIMEMKLWSKKSDTNVVLGYQVQCLLFMILRYNILITPGTKIPVSPLEIAVCTQATDSLTFSCNLHAFTLVWQRIFSTVHV